MRRVIEQGDLRPMRDNRRSMGDLRSILASREALYALADIQLETTRREVPATLAELVAAVGGLIQQRAGGGDGLVHADRRHRVRHHRDGATARRAIGRRVGRPEQSDRRRAGGGGQVHQAGIVADEQGGALQAGRDLRQAEAADQVDRIRQGGQQGRGHRPFRVARAAEHHRPRIRSGHAVKERGETLGRPDLRQPVRRRRQRDHRPIAQHLRDTQPIGPARSRRREGAVARG